MRGIRTQGGFSLMEVVVAIVVFSVGMMGVALVQIKGAHYTRQARMRGEVVVQARALADAMRANLAGVWGVADAADISDRHGDLNGSYYLFEGSAAPSTGGCANPACVRARQDLASWIDQLHASVSLPVDHSNSSGRRELASIKTDANSGLLVITTTWDRQSTGRDVAQDNESYALVFYP